MEKTRHREWGGRADLGTGQRLQGPAGQGFHERFTAGPGNNHSVYLVSLTLQIA